MFVRRGMISGFGITKSSIANHYNLPIFQYILVEVLYVVNAQTRHTQIKFLGKNLYFTLLSHVFAIFQCSNVIGPTRLGMSFFIAVAVVYDRYAMIVVALFH